MVAQRPGALEAAAVTLTGKYLPTPAVAILEGAGPRRPLGAVRRAAGGVGNQAEAPIRAPGEGLRVVGRLGLGHLAV
jgi:hypothetical protein